MAAMRFATHIVAALGFAALTAPGATMPEFSFQPADMIRTNEIFEIHSISQPQTQYAAQFWITPEAQARLQHFASSNLGKDVVLRYGPSVSVTSRWMVKQVSPTFSVSRATREETIQLASSLGLAHDWRLRFGQHPWGLMESPPGRTAWFAGNSQPFWTVSLSAAHCLLVCLGGILSVLILAILFRKRKTRS
jgi:hypothetical protein